MTFSSKNDFIGPVGTYDFHFISGAPQERDNFKTLILPFDEYIWAFLVMSVVLVSITLIFINKIYATFSKESSKESMLESMNISKKLALYGTPYSIGVNPLGFLFVFGTIIDESNGQQQKNSYIAGFTGSKARIFLIFVWMTMGFLLTISYKSVLRAMLMKIEYKETIDTIDDMMESGMPLLIAARTAIPTMMESDPKTKELNKICKQFEMTPSGGIPASIEEG